MSCRYRVEYAALDKSRRETIRLSFLAILFLYINMTFTTGYRQPAAEEYQHAYIVFFSLTDSLDKVNEKLVQACKKYLSGHDCRTYISVGTRLEEMARDVNVLDLDVAPHTVLESIDT